MEKKRDQSMVPATLELEVIEFTDLEQLEESIAPIFLLGADAGGKCSGGTGSGCGCVVPK